MSKKESSGSGSHIGYKVQARLKRVGKPIKIHDGFLTETWRDVDFAECSSSIGVPGDAMNPLARWHTHGMLPINSAIALAWTLIAQTSDLCSSQIECRLAQLKVDYDFSLTREGIVDQSEIECQFFKSLTTKPVEERRNEKLLRT